MAQRADRGSGRWIEAAGGCNSLAAIKSLGRSQERADALVSVVTMQDSLDRGRYRGHLEARCPRCQHARAASAVVLAVMLGP